MSKLSEQNNYELSLPPKRLFRNAKNGRFLKGHAPANKGKKWSEYLSKRKQKQCAKGWINLLKHRIRPDNCGRPKKAVIALMDDGTWKYYPSVGDASKFLGVNRHNIGRCCRENLSRRTLNDVKGRPTNKVNTDHKYMGVRFYFENDNIWTKKVRT